MSIQIQIKKDVIQFLNNLNPHPLTDCAECSTAPVSRSANLNFLVNVQVVNDKELWLLRRIV